MRKGAFLLSDYDGLHFAPWVLRDVDGTSERRMHVPLTELNELCSSPTVQFVEGEELDQWRRYFSFREASMMRRIGLIPFCDGATLLALVLILDCPYLAVDPVTIRLIVSAVHDQMCTLLTLNHQLRMRARFEQVCANQVALQQHIMTELQQKDVHSLTAASIDVAPIISAIRGQTAGVDDYRLRQDVLRIVGSMLEESAVAGLLDSGRICLVLRPDLPVGADLITHQLQLELRDLMTDLAPNIALEPRYTTFTADMESVETALQSL